MAATTVSITKNKDVPEMFSHTLFGILISLLLKNIAGEGF
jgi:hypothetical protein